MELYDIAAFDKKVMGSVQKVSSRPVFLTGVRKLQGSRAGYRVQALLVPSVFLA